MDPTGRFFSAAPAHKGCQTHSSARLRFFVEKRHKDKGECFLEKKGCEHVLTTDMISIMVGRIVEQFEPIRIFLFGSQARGDTTESSDIDLLVVMNNVENKRQAAIDMRVLLKDLPVSKDIIVSTPDEIERQRHVVGTIAYAAFHEGKIVYERN